MYNILNETHLWANKDDWLIDWLIDWFTFNKRNMLTKIAKFGNANTLPIYRGAEQLIVLQGLYFFKSGNNWLN